MSDEKIFVEKKKGINAVALIFIIIVVALLSSVITYKLLKQDIGAVSSNRNDEVSDSVNVKYEIENVENPVVAVAKECSSSIVGITVESVAQNIFGMLQNSESSGSGIVYTEDGYIITNYHVVEAAINSSTAVVKVIMLDETEYTAEIVGGDKVTDLAVLKIEAQGLNAAKFGDSSEVEIGQMAIAIGNPLGQTLAGSVTVGYISAVNRTITSGVTTYNLIQTDAAINSGNSGGALLNTQGEVIGINSVKAYSTGVEGLGFAIPTNDAKPIIEELIENGKIVRPYLGIGGFTLSEEMARKYDLAPGVYVQEVYDGAPAKKAGIKQGDIITKIDDKEVTTFEELNEYKNTKEVGDEVKITIYRNGEEKEFDVKLISDDQ